MSDTVSIKATRPVPRAGSDVATARRALKQALGEFLDPPAIELALQLWRRRFEGEDSLFLRLTFYCREVVKEHGLVGSEAHLHMSVMRALQRNLPMSISMFDGFLQPTTKGRPERHASIRAVGQPATIANASHKKNTEAPGGTAGAVAPVSNRSVAASVLQSFYTALEAQVARQLPSGVTPARVRRVLIRHARSLPHAQRHPACLWWSGQVATLEGEWPAGGYGTALVKVMHSALVELLGKPHTERCFKLAVDRLEASRDSALSSIRSYL